MIVPKHEADSFLTHKAYSCGSQSLLPYHLERCLEPTTKESAIAVVKTLVKRARSPESKDCFNYLFKFDAGIARQILELSLEIGLPVRVAPKHYLLDRGKYGVSPKRAIYRAFAKTQNRHKKGAEDSTRPPTSGPSPRARAQTSCVSPRFGVMRATSPLLPETHT